MSFLKTVWQFLFGKKTKEPEVVIEKNVAEAGIKVALPPVKRTFLQLLTFSSGQRLSVPKELMSARHLGGRSITGVR